MKMKKVFTICLVALVLATSSLPALAYPMYEYGKVNNVIVPIPRNGYRTPKKRKKKDISMGAPTFAEFNITYKSPHGYKTGHRMVNENDTVVSGTTVRAGTISMEILEYYSGHGTLNLLYAMSVKNHKDNPGAVSIVGKWKP